ncbi:MAG: sialidase family protein [Bacteroidia bacterium]|nr:sialidase family protein [Bacteroidia bacterium]
MKNIFIAAVLITFLFSCTNTKNEEKEECVEKTICTDTTAETTCPFLTTDNNGNVVMSYIKEKNDTLAVICYAISTDKGYSFGEPIEIPASKDVHPSAENLPKMAFKPNGEIIAVWGVDNGNPKKKYAGLVYYAQSFDEGKNWSEAKQLVEDTTSIDQRYFDISVLQNGEVGIIWLDSRTKTDKEGSTLYYGETNGKNGFQNEKPIAETICQCCRTDLFVDSKGAIHAAYRDIINDSIRDMVHTISIDGGKTFSSSNRISADNWAIDGCPHTGPTMAENTNGLHFAWYTMGGGSGVFYSFTNDNGKTFSIRDSVSTKPSAKHPQLGALPNGEVIIVWDETIQKGENYNAWVGLQHRTNEGKVVSTQYITADDAISGYPVIKAIDDNEVLVAWVQKHQDVKNKLVENTKQKHSKGGQVYYKMIHLK